MHENRPNNGVKLHENRPNNGVKLHENRPNVEITGVIRAWIFVMVAVVVGNLVGCVLTSRSGGCMLQLCTPASLMCFPSV